MRDKRTPKDVCGEAKVKPPAKKVTFKTTPKKITQQEINQRVNAILSGGKII